MKKIFFFTISLLFFSSCEEDNNISDFPNTETNVEISEIGKYLGAPKYSKSGKFYGGYNYLYNENGSLTEYDFSKVYNLIGHKINPLLECISNDGIPFYSAEGQQISFYFDDAKEAHFIGKDIEFSINDCNNEGITCGYSGSNGAVLATVINTQNNQSLILSNPYNLRETGRIITDPINNIFNVYGRSFSPSGQIKLAKWEILIDKDGNMKEISKEIIEGNNKLDIYGYNNSSIYGSIDNKFLKISPNGTISQYHDSSLSPNSSELLTNDIILNNKQYGVGIYTDFDKQLRAPVFVNFKSENITSIQDFVRDSLIISDQEKLLLNNIGKAFYFESNQQRNSIILSGGLTRKSIKIDFK